MPTYVYKSKADGCKFCRNSFEQKQGINEPALEQCPQCGATVERVICAPFLKTGRSDSSTLSDKNLKKHGFTKLINEGGGNFRKTW
jgi:putative FmdB family regulatory protein